MQYTPEQERIFNFVQLDSNHGIIDAVAGSGKTTTIIESASFIDKNRTVLFCAFNKSIMNEIKARFTEKGLDNIVVKTMHALGFDILKSNSKLNYSFDNLKYKKLVDDYIKTIPDHSLLPILKIKEIDSKPQEKADQERLKKFIFYFKDNLVDINTKFRLTLTQNTFDKFREMVLHFNIFGQHIEESKTFNKELECYKKANDYLLEKGNEMAIKQHLIDFADMLYLPFKFALYPITKYDMLFVDECQDLSNAQIAVALKYVKKSGRLLSVGDPYQSIYGFAGADIESYNRIKKIPNTVQLSLSKCFRCPDNVIELAQNFRDDITSFKPKSGKIHKVRFEDIVSLVKPGDLIISRIRTPLLELLFLLLEKEIDVEVHEDDVKDVINSIRFIFTKDELKKPDIQSIIEETRNRNIYFIQKDASEIEDSDERELYIKRETELLDAKLSLVQRQMSIHVDVNNINEVLKKIEQLISGNINAVKLSTIHRAKGLENDTVFILDYNLLPLYRDHQKEWEKVQERNLKYVALTRTKKNLYLASARQFNSIVEDTLFDSLDWLLD